MKTRKNIFDKYDNILFDLYGTLIDIRTDEMAASNWKKWLRWLDRHGVKHPEYMRMRKDFFDMDRRDRKIALNTGKYAVPEIDIIPVYRELFEKYGNPECSDAFLEEAAYAFREATRYYYRLFPGVAEFLKKMRNEGKRLYLLSNAQASYTLPEIKALHIDEMLDDIMMSSDRLCMKPDRAFYEMLIFEKGLDKSRTVMLGDSYVNDVQGAIDAGIDAIHLAGENHPSVFYLEN